MQDAVLTGINLKEVGAPSSPLRQYASWPGCPPMPLKQVLESAPGRPTSRTW